MLPIQIEIIYHVFSQHALRVNMARGQTEALVRLRGEGAKATRQLFFGQGYVLFQTPDGKDLKLL
eukprot:8595187-Lingulodinium_polyedra.AAC.1